MQHNGLAKLRHDLCRAQGIENHAAAARAQLDDAHLPGRSHRLPGRGGPQSKQLAKHLADFGSRYEVALPADGHMAGIVTVLRMGKAQLHVLSNRETSGALDPAADLCLERS